MSIWPTGNQCRPSDVQAISSSLQSWSEIAKLHDDLEPNKITTFFAKHVFVFRFAFRFAQLVVQLSLFHSAPRFRRRLRPMSDARLRSRRRPMTPACQRTVAPARLQKAGQHLDWHRQSTHTSQRHGSARRHVERRHAIDSNVRVDCTRSAESTALGATHNSTCRCGRRKTNVSRLTLQPCRRSAIVPRSQNGPPTLSQITTQPVSKKHVFNFQFAFRLAQLVQATFAFRLWPAAVASTNGRLPLVGHAR